MPYFYDCPWDCDCDECELEHHAMMTEGMDDGQIEEYYDEYHADIDIHAEREFDQLARALIRALD